MFGLRTFFSQELLANVAVLSYSMVFLALVVFVCHKAGMQTQTLVLPGNIIKILSTSLIC